MNRTFFIKHDNRDWQEYTGPLSYGRMDAIKDYTRDHLPGWTTTGPGHHTENRDGHALYAAEVINPDQTIGARIWIRQPY